MSPRFEFLGVSWVLANYMAQLAPTFSVVRWAGVAWHSYTGRITNNPSLAMACVLNPVDRNASRLRVHGYAHVRAIRYTRQFSRHCASQIGAM